MRNFSKSSGKSYFAIILWIPAFYEAVTYNES
jgi:hypothetical protein